MTSLSRTLALTAAIGLLSAAPAAADSIAYVQGGDLWLTTTDVARQFRVTDTGGYTTVSQADDGTLLATTDGGHLRRLDRLGGVLSDIPTPVSGGDGNPAFLFYGPYDADLSPDGATAAYGYDYQSWTSTHIDADTVTAFSRSDALTGVTEEGYKQTKGWNAPEFIDDGRVLVSSGPGWPDDPIAVVAVGSGTRQGWFSDPDNPHPHEATLSRNRRLVAATNADRTELHVYWDEDATPLGTVHTCFTYSDAQPVEYSSPTFNADGTVLAFADGRGLAVSRVGADQTGHCPTAEDYVDVLPGASNPDWGPADVPSGRPAASGGGGQSAPAAPAAGTVAPVPARPLPAPAAHPTSLRLAAASTTTRRLLRRGATVTVTVPQAGRVRVRAARAGRVVAIGRVVAKAAGPVRVRLVVTSRAARRIVRRATSLTTTATQAGASATGTLSLHR